MDPRREEVAPARVVLDTNVVLSALLFAKGRLAWLRAAWQGGRICPLISRETVEELIAALAYPKFKLSAGERQDLLADYLPWCETIAIPDPPPKVPKCRDAGDMPFLRLAAAAKADYLVTGDNDLHAIARIFTVPIVTTESLRKGLKA